MARLTKSINISLDEDLYEKIKCISREESITKGDLILEALTQYVSKRKWINIREYGKSAAEKLKIKDDKDIDNILHEK